MRRDAADGDDRRSRGGARGGVPPLSLDAPATLLAVPNLSEGSDRERIAALTEAFGGAALLLDRHSDPRHGRTVLSLGGDPGRLAPALLAGARRAIEVIDLREHAGAHPRIGALDVCPVVYTRPDWREAARELAHQVAAGLAVLELPVFLYGELASEPERRERAYFRRGGPEELARRMAAGELRADLGPDRPHPTAGAVLVTARPPLAAFNVELVGATIERAREIAAGVRESGGGLPGVRAIAVELARGRVQISTNVHDPALVPLGRLVADIRRRAAALGARPVAAELVGLIPEAALVDYPIDVPIRDFRPEERTIEARLRAVG